MNTSASFNIGGKVESLKVLSDEQPSIYEDNKTHSGHAVKRAFCGKCGTALYSTPTDPKFSGVVFVKGRQGSQRCSLPKYPIG
jgi:hypothetical protein